MLDQILVRVVDKKATAKSGVKNVVKSHVENVINELSVHVVGGRRQFKEPNAFIQEAAYQQGSTMTNQ